MEMFGKGENIVCASLVTVPVPEDGRQVFQLAQSSTWPMVFITLHRLFARLTKGVAVPGRVVSEYYAFEDAGLDVDSMAVQLTVSRFSNDGSVPRRQKRQDVVDLPFGLSTAAITLQPSVGPANEADSDSDEGEDERLDSETESSSSSTSSEAPQKKQEATAANACCFKGSVAASCGRGGGA